MQVSVIELMDHVLSMYDRAIGAYTAAQFSRSGIRLVLNSRVKAVADGAVTVVDKENNVRGRRCGRWLRAVLVLAWQRWRNGGGGQWRPHWMQGWPALRASTRHGSLRLNPAQPALPAPPRTCRSR